jgi:hypothetical protein
MPARRSPVQSLTFEYRLAQEAINLRLQANGCLLASAARSFCEKPGRSMLPGRLTTGCPQRDYSRPLEFLSCS